MSRRFWQLALLLLLLTIGLAGCAGGSRAALTGASWPGVTLADDVFYVAFGSQAFAIEPDEPDTALWAFPDDPGRRQTFYAPPAVDGDLVVVSDYTDSIFGVDAATGEQLWVYQTGTQGGPFNLFRSDIARFIGGATIGERLVYAGVVDGTLYALDRDDGSVTWTFKAESDIWATPLLLDGTLYVASLDRHIYALDADDGDLLWSFPQSEGGIDIGPVVGQPTYYEGNLIFGSLTNRVYSLDIETRSLEWSYDTENWLWSSPTVDPETGILVGGDLDGHVFALNAEDGDAIWTFDTDGPVVGQPAISNTGDETIVYVTSGDSNVYARNLEDGSEAQAPHSIMTEFTTRFLIVPTGTDLRPVPIYGPPILYEDAIVIGVHEGDFPLIAFAQDDFEELWSFAPTGATRTSSAENGDAQEEPASPFSNILNLLLPIMIAFLLVSMLNRNRRTQK